MVQISEAASLALHSMALLTKANGAPCTVATMAATTKASQAHLAKVLQRLAKANLVSATRGPSGGYTLASRGADITLLEVYEAIEGPLCITTCLLRESECPFQQCMFKGVLGKLGADFHQYLSSHTLRDVCA